jgi:N-acetylmuramoyl-L-alanine amidase
MRVRGKVSHFGGPEDQGVSPDEGLAFIYEVSDAPRLFLPTQPPGTTGLARRLNPEMPYIAMRWDYDKTPKDMLLRIMCLVRAPKTGKIFFAKPADWGPHSDTDRIADISPGLMKALGIETDDEIEVLYPETERPVEDTQMAVVISSGHGKLVRGASGFIDEVDEARRMLPEIAAYLREQGWTVITFNDDTSTTQNENLNTIVNFHNKQTRDLDVSIHFNAFETTEGPMGTEVCYLTQETLAANVANAIALDGELLNRGPKKREDLFFLNNTDQPAILIETCFVDSLADTENYELHFFDICNAIAKAIVSNAAIT